MSLSAGRLLVWRRFGYLALVVWFLVVWVAAARSIAENFKVNFATATNLLLTMSPVKAAILLLSPVVASLILIVPFWVLKRQGKILFAFGIVISLTSAILVIVIRPPAWLPYFLQESFWRRGLVETSMFALLVLTISLLLPQLLRLFWPRLTVPVMVLATLLLTGLFAMGGQALTSLFLMLWLVLVWHELGRLAIRLMEVSPTDWFELFVLRLGMGSGVLSLLGLFAGWFGWLTLPLILSVMFLATGTVLYRWRRVCFSTETMGLVVIRLRRFLAGKGRSAKFEVEGWFETALLGVATGAMIIGFVTAIAPETSSDALRVHQVVARYFAENRFSMAVPQIGYANIPMHGQMQYAFAWLLQGAVLAKLIHFMTGAIAVLATGVLACRYAGGLAGLTAAAMTATLPMLMWELGVGYVDLFVVMYAVLGSLCLLYWLETRDWRWLIWLGASLGFGVASKLTMGYIAAGFVAALVLDRSREIRPAERVKTILIVSLGGLFALGPWLLRSYKLTGTIPGLTLLLDAIGRSEGKAPPESLANLPFFGVGRSLSALLGVPWTLTFSTGLFVEGLSGFIGFTILLSLPLLLLLRFGRETQALLIAALGSFLFWFYTVQYARFLLPTLALLCVLGSAGFARLLHLGGDSKPGGLRAIRFFLQASLIGLLLAAIVSFLSTILIQRGGLPTRLALGRQSPAQYLADHVLGFETLQRLDRLVPPATPVAMMPDDGPRLYTHASLYTPFQDARYLRSERSIPALLEQLQRQKISWLVLMYPTIPAHWLEDKAAVLKEEFLARYCQVIYSRGGVQLLRIWPRGLPPKPPEEELAANPGFEQIENGQPIGWKYFGDPSLSMSPADAHSGQVSATVNDRHGLWQTIRVRAGRGYRLSGFFRSDRPDANIRYEIEWFDEADRLLDFEYEVNPSLKSYRRHNMFAFAPVGAAHAVIRLLGYGPAFNQLDDVSFVGID